LKRILHSTRGVIFLGTPHHGAALATWAEHLARSIGLIKQTNPDIVQVLRTDSEVLARIQDSFHTMVRARNQQGIQPIEITCFYEELPLPGVGIVGFSSSLPIYMPILDWQLIFLIGCSIALGHPSGLHTNKYQC
jgi:protein SERAC1